MRCHRLGGDAASRESSRRLSSASKREREGEVARFPSQELHPERTLDNAYHTVFGAMPNASVSLTSVTMTIVAN